MWNAGGVLYHVDTIHPVFSFKVVTDETVHRTTRAEDLV